MCSTGIWPACVLIQCFAHATHRFDPLLNSPPDLDWTVSGLISVLAWSGQFMSWMSIQGRADVSWMDGHNRNLTLSLFPLCACVSG
mmetsp:Transcript_20748/g.34173  ORF Transcript_20748/g.34173 Transcript_20748/m.34173 type:complete len:86 (-) Transcript_20748:2666-2923(-)